MRQPHWTSTHRDALLARVTVLTAGVAAVSAVGAVALGAGLQAGTSYAASSKPSTPKPAAGPALAPGGVAASGSGSESESESSDGPSDGASAPSTSTTPLKPDAIHLLVYNATGVRGVANAAALVLRSEGFLVDTVATYPSGALNSSAIVYSADAAAGVRAVSKATGISRSASGSTGSAVALVLGRDWLAATAGTAWAPPQAAQQGNGGGGTVTSSGGS